MDEYRHLETLLERYPALVGQKEQIARGYELMKEGFARGGKLMIAGNGGSASDAQHIVGELMKRFHMARPVTAGFAEKLKSIDPDRGELLAQKLERNLPAIALTAHEALTTAYCNDVDASCVYAQQLMGFGKPGDVFLGISTSGGSKNVLNAAVTAKAMGISVVGLTGGTGKELAKIADAAVTVPETDTYRIQELHLPVYHCWCLMLEEHFFGK